MKINKAISRTLLASAIAATALVGSASAQPAQEPVHVKVNGVDLYDSFKSSGTTWVNVSRYAQFTNASVKTTGNQATVNGKTVNVSNKNGVAYAKVRDLAEATGALNIKWNPDKQEVYVLQLPKDTVKVTPALPAMGEHWANPAELPEGPIYGVNNGELIFLEYMIPKATFDKGENVVELGGLKGLASPAVQHTDMELQPTGHEGMEIPHYDIHHYFVSHAEHMAIKGDLPPAAAQHDAGSHTN